MDFITCCGVCGWVGILVILTGVILVVTYGRKAGNPGGVATAFVVAALAVGAVGFGPGIHAVEGAVRKLPAADTMKRVADLAAGNLMPETVF